MSKNFNRLWVFGDSYSTPNFYVTPQESYWGLTATELKIPTIKNCSRQRNSWESVQHLVVGSHLDFNWDSDLFFIAIPPLERITVYDDGKDTVYNAVEYNTSNWHDETFDVLCHRGLDTLQNYGSDRQLILHTDRTWLETTTLRQLFLLTKWLDSYNACYLILNHSKNFMENDVWGPNEFLLPYFVKHSRCILFRDTYQSINVDVNKPIDYDKAKWYGHHGSEGNRYFFEKSLLPALKRNEFC